MTIKIPFGLYQINSEWIKDVNVKVKLWKDVEDIEKRKRIGKFHYKIGGVVSNSDSKPRNQEKN